MFPCPLSHGLPNGKKCIKVITFTPYDEARVSKSACPSTLFIVSHYWLCASLPWEPYFCQGRRQTCKNWFCEGWTLVSGLCAYHCPQPPWILPLKCATLFITGSKDLKPVRDVHTCASVCGSQMSAVGVVHHDKGHLAVLRLSLTLT